MRALQGDVGGLVADDLQRLGDRDAGLHEDGELTREVHQLLLLHLLLGELDADHVPRFSSILTGYEVLVEQVRARCHRSCRPW